MKLETMPCIAKSMAELNISTMLTALPGEGILVDILRSDAPLKEKIDYLLNEFNQGESNRNTMYVVLGRDLYRAIEQYDSRYNF